MKVLYLITRSERGGGQVHLVDLLAGFRRQIDLVVGVGEEGYLTEECSRLNVPFHVLPSLVQPISPSKDLRALIETISLIRQVRPNLIHPHTSKAGLLGRIAGLATGVPIIFTAHTWSFAEGISSKQRFISLPLERLVARGRQIIINVSEANRALAITNRIASPDQHVTIWNGVADTVLRADPTRNNPPKIIMVARFAPQKNHFLLVQALANIDLPYSLDLVGDGPTRLEVEREVARLGLQSKVRFLGDRSDVAQLLADSQVFALSTNWEGLPYSIIEAMRAGLPVLCTDVGGINESVRDGINGFLVERGNKMQLTARMRELLESPELRLRLGNAGRTDYERHFTVDVMLAKTMACYCKILNLPVKEPVHANVD